MRIVISGAAGFVGSNLADQLISNGHQVVGLDNFITGRAQNVAHLQGNRAFRLIEQDVIRDAAVDGPVDRIYHLASPASPVAYASHRIATMQVNAAGTWNLLELAVAKGARFLVASTSEIYGEPQKAVQKEELWGVVNPIGLRSVYEEAKRFGEACTMAYHREKDADTRIVRMFNTYGPRMHPADGRVVTNFVRQALTGQPITITGDGMQTRTFCYVSDTVRGLVAAMEADFHEPINIGNPGQTTILELAKRVIELCPGSASRIEFEPLSDYDPRSRCPDIMRARQILGWSPRVGLQEGLREVVEYHRKEMAASGR